MALTDDDVREILRIIDDADLAELRIETKEFSLYVRRGAGREDASPRSAEQLTPQEANANGSVTIEAPMLGTFYRSESSGAPPFVQPGSEVGPETIVCIIEVMKMMNSVPAGVSGVVTEVVAENAELVEYGAPLFRVQPG
jgi:acetyl-CoA carboxylase biotin carboxyl carrier protein